MGFQALHIGTHERGHLPLVCNCFGVADELVDRNEQRGVTGQLAMTVDDVRQLCLRLQVVA